MTDVRMTVGGSEEAGGPLTEKQITKMLEDVVLEAGLDPLSPEGTAAPGLPPLACHGALMMMHDA